LESDIVNLVSSEDAISFVANVIGVLLGAFLGYLLGLRQQRKIDYERDQKKKRELIEALKVELNYIVTETVQKPVTGSEIFDQLNFDVIVFDLPAFTSIVNSGQLLLLDSSTVAALRELNTEIHEHNTAQAIFLGVAGSNSDRLNAIAENRDPEAKGRLGALLKVILTKRDGIAEKARKLIQDMSTDD
jgi:hypothetical protein